LALLISMLARTPFTICATEAPDAHDALPHAPLSTSAAMLHVNALSAGGAAAPAALARHATMHAAPPSAAPVAVKPREAKYSRMRSTARCTRFRAASSLIPMNLPMSRYVRLPK
jgi:hypothetical protein